MFLLPYANGNNVTDENSYRKYFLTRLRIKNYNIETDRRNFCDQPTNDSIKQYNKVKKKYQQDKGMITQLVVY